MRSSILGARALASAALAAAVLFAAAPPAPAAAADPGSQAARVIRIAMAQRGDPWRYGATGPRAFDCSGLVIYSFRQAGLARVVGYGHFRSARALYRYFARRGLATRSNPQVGDLVVWGGGTHVGIYIGRGRAISTLTSGVRVHGVHAVRARFTAYLRTGLSLTAPAPAVVATSPAPTVAPSPSPSLEPTPSLDAAAAPVPSLAPDPSPSPSAGPSSSLESSPQPSATPSPDPSLPPTTEPDPAPSPEPSPTP